jgi:hypothetical protein
MEVIISYVFSRLLQKITAVKSFTGQAPRTLSALITSAGANPKAKAILCNWIPFEACAINILRL